MHVRRMSRRAIRRVVSAMAGIVLAGAGLTLFADATPQALPFGQDWSNTALITVNDDWSAVPGIEGFRGDGLTSATGADPQTLVAEDLAPVPDVNANQTNPNTFATGGVAEFALADPVVALNGSGTADAPYLQITVSTTGVAGVRVRYTLRDLDGSVDDAVQPVALHFRVGTSGAWTNVPAAFVADATSGPSLATLVTPVDVTLPAAADDQAVVQLRIMTANAAGNDEWVGVDDLVVEPATAPTSPSFSGATGTPNPVEWGQTLVVAAGVVPGSNPPGTIHTVTADATALGGPALLPLSDDGIAPDQAAGDLVFTGAVVVAPSAGVGARGIPLVVQDERGRTGAGTLTVQVTAPVPVVTIAQIQGAGAVSPYTGQAVRTTGVVTARRTNGVYVQSTAADEDGDPATSEGIFVFTGSAPGAAFQPGTLVSVQGVVAEFAPAADPVSPPVTELVSPALAALGTAALPAPVVLSPADADPAGGLLQLERLEGMLVTAPSLTAVSGVAGSVNETSNTGTNNGVFYAVLSGTARPVREAGIEALDPVPVCAAGTGCAIPVFDGNPERIRVDADGIAGVAAAVVTTGAVMTDVTAVVDYGFRTWTLLPVAPLMPVGGLVAAPARAPAAGEFAVASFNLQRFFDTVNDPATSDAVPTPAAYAVRLAKFSAVVRHYLHAPAIIGVQEAENLQVLQDLAATIDADAAAAGQPVPGYQAYLVEGNDVGGIDVGVLAASGVTVHDVVQHGKDDTYLDPNTGQPALLNDRPSLSMRATIAAAPGTLPADVIVVVHHLRSLNGLTDPVDGPRVRAKRLAQAEYVARLLGDLRASHPGLPIVSVGDYNAFEVNDGHVDVLGVARGVPAPATEVVSFGADLLSPDFELAPAVAGTPADGTYSYVFDGNAQSLDHVLLSPEAATTLTAFDHARVNADFPDLLRGDAARVERTSDHDPAVAYFRFPTDTTPPVVTVPDDLVADAQGPLGAVVTFTATATDDVSGPVPVTCVPASGSLFAYGPTSVTCTASDAFGNTGSASFRVTVVDPATAGLVAGATVQDPGRDATRVIFTAVRTSAHGTGAAVLAQGRGTTGAPMLFAATRIDAVGFFDDPASSPGARPASGVDTVRVAGAGVVNGRPGYTFELAAADRGEPGRGADEVRIVVRDAQGAVVLSAAGVIDAGNVDSLPVP
ncbi:MAG: HYR domain-containing protein [Vicinamibacterales bacterium]